MKSSVVVTGLGAITPLGHNIPAIWQALLAGHSGVRPISHFDASSFKTQIAATVQDFEPRDHFDRKEARRFDRFIQFAVVAAREAIADAQLMFNQGCTERIGVYIGTGFGGVSTFQKQIEDSQRRGQHRVSPFFIPMMIANMASSQVAIAWGLKGPIMSPMTACAAGTDSIGQAAEVIHRGEADVMICGGSEAALTPAIIAGFEPMGVLSTGNNEPEQACRPFDANRDGCVLGEGAAVIVLESLAHAIRRGARVYAELSGYGTTSDAFHATSPSKKGAGIARAMRIAVDKSELPPTAVDYINAHGTGTIHNDRAETAGIKAAFGDQAYRLTVSSTKPTMGHLLGAAGAIEAIISVKALDTQTILPTLNYQHPDPNCDLDYAPGKARQTHLNVALTNSIGFGGQNATLAFRRWV